jgi:hypothetical protein
MYTYVVTLGFNLARRKVPDPFDRLAGREPGIVPGLPDPGSQDTQSSFPLNLFNPLVSSGNFRHAYGRFSILVNILRWHVRYAWNSGMPVSLPGSSHMAMTLFIIPRQASNHGLLPDTFCQR